MRFYNREEELKELKRIQQLAFEESSRMTVVTGRRRIGKTSLIMKAVEQTPTVYLFIGRKNEATLCEEFIPLIAQALQIFVPTEIRSFRNLFQYLMQLSTQRTFNLVIDEFQEFYTINESKFFQDNKGPLFGRADNIIKLSAFSLSVLKEIMHEYAPTHSNDDLLALYTFTGGVPKYVELFCDNHTLHVESMIHFMARDETMCLSLEDM